MGKRITKRFMAFLLAVVFTVALVSTMPAMAAESGTCGDNLTWTLDDAGTLTISGTGDMRDWNRYSDVPWYGSRESIKTAVIESSVTSIGDRAFRDCGGLTSVTIPNSVTSIGNYAFKRCKGLTSVTIGNSVTSIGYEAFVGCSRLTDIKVDENNTSYCDVDGVLFNKDKTELIQYAIGKTDTSYAIPDSVTSIADSSFAWCGGLTSVTIGNSITSIAESAFAYCDGLTSVTIPDSVTNIGESAFWGCDSLTYVYYSSTEEQWKAIKIDSSNSVLTNATISYNYPIAAIGEYFGKVNAVVKTMADSVRVELEVTDGAQITENDVDVFAAVYSGGTFEKAVKLAPSTDGDIIVYTGTVSGDDYKIFVWDKSLAPVTEKYEH